MLLSGSKMKNYFKMVTFEQVYLAYLLKKALFSFCHYIDRNINYRRNNTLKISPNISSNPQKNRFLSRNANSQKTTN